MSEDVKTFVFPGSMTGNSGNLDPNLLLGMGNGGFGGGMWNNPIWALVFLAFLGNGGFGFGNGNGNCATNGQLNAIREQLTDNQNSQLLMDAIKGNSGAIHELATNLNCNTNAIQSAINGVQSAICNVSNQVGMSSAQVINAIQSGNMSLANTLQNCCCEVKQLVTNFGYENQISNLQQSQLIQNGFAQVGYASAEQTCQLKQNGNDNTNRIIAKLDAMEDSRKDREINALTAALATANARAERAAELAPITKALADIQGKQPSTVSIPYPQLTAIPTAQLYGYGYNGLYGYNGAGVFG